MKPQSTGTPFLFALLASTTLASDGVDVLSTGPNTTVIKHENYGDVELEHPVPAGTMMHGLEVVEWCDADYLTCVAGGDYEDWDVSQPCEPSCMCAIDGDSNEVWMRLPGQYVFTSTTIATEVVAITLVGDANDGLARVYVDGVERAFLDMHSPNAEPITVWVENLNNIAHDIEVLADGQSFDGNGHDVAVLGAAALEAAVGATAYCVPPGPNSTSPLGCYIYHNSGAPGRTLVLDVVDSAILQPGVFYWGPLQMDVPFGCGRRCVGGQVTRSGVFLAGPTGSLTASIDTSNATSPFNIQWWFRDPLGCISDGYNLSSALAY